METTDILSMGVCSQSVNGMKGLFPKPVSSRQTAGVATDSPALGEDRILLGSGMPFILSVESFVEIRPGLVKQFRPGHKHPKSVLKPLCIILSLTGVLESLTQLKGLEKTFSQVTCTDKLNPLKFSTMWCLCAA